MTKEFTLTLKEWRKILCNKRRQRPINKKQSTQQTNYPDQAKNGPDLQKKTNDKIQVKRPDQTISEVSCKRKVQIRKVSKKKPKTSNQPEAGKTCTSYLSSSIQNLFPSLVSKTCNISVTSTQEQETDASR